MDGTIILGAVTAGSSGFLVGEMLWERGGWHSILKWPDETNEVYPSHWMPRPARPNACPQMPPYQERVVAEKADLDERMERLAEYMRGERFFTENDEEEQIRLIRQSNAMLHYSEVLGDRIAHFSR